MTTEELAAIEARKNAAIKDAPLPWNAISRGGHAGAYEDFRGWEIDVIEQPQRGQFSYYSAADFTAHAPEDIDRLIAAYRALAAERDAMLDVVAAARTLIPYAVDGTMDYDGWQVLIRLNAAVKALEAP